MRQTTEDSFAHWRLIVWPKWCLLTKNDQLPVQFLWLPSSSPVHQCSSPSLLFFLRQLNPLSRSLSHFTLAQNLRQQRKMCLLSLHSVHWLNVVCLDYVGGRIVTAAAAAALVVVVILVGSQQQLSLSLFIFLSKFSVNSAAPVKSMI